MVGVVVPATGRLARLGLPLEFAARAFPWPFEVAAHALANADRGTPVAEVPARTRPATGVLDRTTSPSPRAVA